VFLTSDIKSASSCQGTQDEEQDAQRKDTIVVDVSHSERIAVDRSMNLRLLSGPHITVKRIFHDWLPQGGLFKKIYI
jgi:hypothetical protein